MAFTGDNRPGTQAPVALIDDARKRRRGRGRGRKRPHPDDEHALESSGEDYSGYALGLADSLLSTDADPASASSPDEILARHERASENASSAPAVEEPQPAAAADEILLALEAHHHRREPHERRPAPRGSAELDAQQPQRPRPNAKRAREQRKCLLARPLLIGVGAIATVAVGVTIAMTNTSTTASKVADHPSSANQNAPVLTLGTIEIPNLSLLAADHHHGAEPRVRSQPRPRVKHAAAAHSASAPPASAASPSSTSTPNSTGGASASATTPTYSSQPTNSTSQSTAPSSAQPAGPAGPGSTVGGNCNPKCS
jgi:hypothetical protein